MNELLPSPLALTIVLPIVLFIVLFALRWLYRRVQLSRAKHSSLSGHSRMAKRIARLIPLYEFGPGRFFAADGAPVEVANRRRAGFEQLAASFRQRSPESIAMLARLSEGISDLRFVGRYRVPFQFSRLVRENLASGVVVQASRGEMLIDIDGNEFIDLTGAYGVNVFGNEFYKECMAEGLATVAKLGAVLGPYHPVVEGNVQRLKAISGLDEVSFHMSGTEAVMQAVRLARYHTGRTHIVRFCGAYHGWWDDVQPGIGNPSSPGKVYTLKEMSRDTLRVLAGRRNIACVLVNPLQALHPNGSAPADGSLIASNRSAHFDREAYSRWLKELRQVCDQAGIVLILDEVFVGFRIAPGGAQEYFDIRADLVTYGKTLGGGLPVGVLCGRGDLMRRYREQRPVDICFARGTFNSHPVVMGAMSAFLDRLQGTQVQHLYAGLDECWNARAGQFNQAMKDAGLPIAVANLSSIFTVLYETPSRYNWMLQFYLNDEGLLLPWVGTGRLIFSLDFDDAAFGRVLERFVAAGRRMNDDGWWWNDGQLTNKTIKRMVLREALAAAFGRPGEAD